MIKISAPKSHPRYLSLYYRDLLTWGVKQGITSLQGLTAHGRGEAFDYLLGEKTHNFAMAAIRQTARLLVNSKHPVISVNGNTAVLVPDGLIKLSKILKAPLEINLFHKSKIREKKIKIFLLKSGTENVLLPDRAKITGLTSNRKYISSKGQFVSDIVFVPLEDGDRTQYLKKMGKKVITVDLNPLSRTAGKADITIVDNIVRTLPLLIKEIKKLKKNNKIRINPQYNNHQILQSALRFITRRLKKLASSL